MTTEAMICLCTCPSLEVARALARRVVEAGLAACVNVVPGINSIYRWQGAICDDAEVLLIIKTTPRSYAALETLVVAEHPYELPELIAVSIDHGSAPYLSWLIDSIQLS